MSVLIEALSLVIPKKVLDVSYPGGTDSFVEDALKLDKPPRYVCHGDAHLVNLSFFDVNHVEPLEQRLVGHGIVIADGDRFFELAFVDQHFGPIMPCDWLEWRRHSEGFTCAWLAGTEAGDMATPADWTLEHSRDLVRHDIRDEPGRCIMLADEGGLETWLDFETGRLERGLPQRDENPLIASGGEPEAG